MRNAGILFATLVAAGSMLAARGAHAQPADPGCAVAIDDLGAFVGDVGRRDVTKVKLNAAFSHLSDSALTAAVLREGYLFEKSRNGREPSLDDKVMAYALGVKLLDAWTANAAGDQAYEGFQKAYNLGKNLSLWDAASKIDHDRGVTRETIEYIKSKLGGT